MESGFFFFSFKNGDGDARSGIAWAACSSFQATRSVRLVSLGSLSKLVETKFSKTPENSWSGAKVQ